MATEAKRKFGNQELDVLDEIRFLLESQADLMDPAGDQTITAARGFSSVKADILDRIRRATERQFKHSGSIFSGDVLVTGVAPQLIKAITGQYEEIQNGTTHNVISTTASTNVIRLAGSIDEFNPPKYVTLSGCDVASDDGTYSVVNVFIDRMLPWFEIEVSEALTGGTTSGSGQIKRAFNRMVVNSAIGLKTETKFSVVDSDNADGEYTFVAETPFDDNGTTKYFITTVETVPECAVWGTLYSIETFDDCVIANPFNSLFTTLYLWKADGTVINPLQTTIIKTASQITITSAFFSLCGSDWHVGDFIHYSIDSHV